MSSSRRLGLTLGSTLLLWNLAVGSAHASRIALVAADGAGRTAVASQSETRDK